MLLQKKYILPLFFFLFIAINGLAQSNVFNSSFSNIRKRANNFYEKHYYKQALDLYIQALQKDDADNFVKIRIANCYIKLQEPAEAVVWYDKIPENDTLFNNQQILQFAHALAQNGDLQNAEKWYRKYGESNSNEKRINNILRYLEKPESLREDTTNYDVEEVAISTESPELAATYYGNEGVVFVGTFKKTSSIKYASLVSDDTYFDLYLSTFSTDPLDDKKKILNTPIFFDKKINSKLHEGPLTFARQETKIIFTRNLNTAWPKEKSSDGLVRLGLFEAERDDRTLSKWKNIREFPFNSREYSVCHPTLNRDGTIIYFASDMPGGFGGFDLYKSTYADGYWTQPQNLGERVNTEGNEVYPFLHNDETIYFASNGMGGLGGLDIYKVDLTDNGQLTEVYHLVNPINSTSDDYAMILDPIGTAGYISSNRKGGMNDDLFKIFEADAYKTKEINYIISGIISTPPTSKDNAYQDYVALDSVELKLVENLTKDTLAIVYTNSEGKFEFSKKNGDIKYPGEYQVLLSKPSFDNTFFNFEIPENDSYEDNAITVTMIPEIVYNPNLAKNDSTPIDNQTEEVEAEIDLSIFDFGETIPETPVNNEENSNATTNNQTDEVFEEVSSPKRTSFNLYGQVFEGNGNKKLTDARIYASTSEGGMFNMITVDEKGNFNLDLETNSSYILKAVLSGYSSDCFLVEPIEPDAKYKQNEPFRIFPITPKDTLITLKSLKYSSKNWKLSESSYAQLQDVIAFLRSNSSYIIEVGAYTTRNGNFAFNKGISTLQSLSIIEYLISQGISRKRLVAKGYGERGSIHPCPNGNCSEEEKNENERIEIKVVAYLENFVSEIREFSEVKNGVKLTRINCSNLQELSEDNNETIFEGSIVDSNSQLALDSALVYIYNTSSGNLKKIYSDSSGNFLTHLTTKQEYVIKAFKENHKPACHIVKVNDGVVRKVYPVTWSLDYMKDMSKEEQKREGFWGGNPNYTTCIEN